MTNTHIIQYAQPSAFVAVGGALGALMDAVHAGTRESRRHAIAALEAAMSKCPQVEQPVEHNFVPGLYARKIFNPKDSLIVTKEHRQANFSFILRGRLGVITEEGMKILEAPAFFATQPGTKRVLYSQEDTEFVTVHPNPDNVEDLRVLEARIIGPLFDEVSA